MIATTVTTSPKISCSASLSKSNEATQVASQHKVTQERKTYVWSLDESNSFAQNAWKSICISPYMQVYDASVHFIPTNLDKPLKKSNHLDSMFQPSCSIFGSPQKTVIFCLSAWLFPFVFFAKKTKG